MGQTVAVERPENEWRTYHGAEPEHQEGFRQECATRQHQCWQGNWGRCPHLSRSPSHAEDADGPHGRHCHDQRRQRHSQGDHCPAPCCQDDEVGDGTTSVIVLAAEMLGVSHQFLEEKMHPTVVIQAYRQALEDAAVILADNVSTKIDLDDAVAVRKVIQSCVGTKFIAKWSDLACDIAMDAVKTVTMIAGDKKEIDIKRYAKVEKIPGGTIEDSAVLKGVMFNKDVTHPKMKRRIENPRILLLDCNLEYKKGESQTNIEIMNEGDFSKILEQEETYIKKITVQHPAAKTMIEIARTQDEEVGDGTTSVIILAAEVLGISHQFLEEKIHPTVIIQAYRQ